MFLFINNRMFMCVYTRARVHMHAPMYEYPILILLCYSNFVLWTPKNTSPLLKLVDEAKLKVKGWHE